MYIDYSGQWKDDDLVRTVSAFVNSEVDNVIVTPKLLSRPLLNNSTAGRLFNQFQSFAFAYGNQLAPTVAARPGTQIARFAAMAVFWGAISDSLHNQLSGRRSLADSARLWSENPQGMFYAAANRAGMFGWLARPLAIADGAGFGPGPIMGNNVSSMQAAQALSVAGNISPFVDWADLLTQGAVYPMATKVGRLLGADTPDVPFNAKRRHTTRKALPYQNLLWNELLYQATSAVGIDNPIGRGTGIDPFLTRPAVDADRPPLEAQP